MWLLKKFEFIETISSAKETLFFVQIVQLITNENSCMYK